MKLSPGLLIVSLMFALGFAACDDDPKDTNNTNNVNNVNNTNNQNNTNNAVCGDSVVDESEQCDEGAANSLDPDACRPDCTLPVCGDGILDLTQAYGEEQCDEGEANADEPDTCRTDCSLPFCGDAILDVLAGEECDYGTNSWEPNACRPGCLNPRCGDSMIDTLPAWGSEVCDDGDTDAEDGCSATCQIELGWSCTGQPSVCTAGCGDGLVRGSEECDDQTDFTPVSGDGCSAFCRVEMGWACFGEPSACSPVCGDGLRVGTETDPSRCDDANTSPNDGCDATCFVEEGWTCTGSPSVCSPN